MVVLLGHDFGVIFLSNQELNYSLLNNIWVVSIFFHYRPSCTFALFAYVRISLRFSEAELLHQWAIPLSLYFFPCITPAPVLIGAGKFPSSKSI